MAIIQKMFRKKEYSTMYKINMNGLNGKVVISYIFSGAETPSKSNAWAKVN
jgi:hypothetical protein